MRTGLLLLIRLYWLMAPKREKGKCLFHISCSHQVYSITREQGLYPGLKVLRFRFLNCRGGYQLIQHPAGNKAMVLAGGQLIGEEEMAERFR